MIKTVVPGKVPIVCDKENDTAFYSDQSLKYLFRKHPDFTKVLWAYYLCPLRFTFQCYFRVKVILRIMRSSSGFRLFLWSWQGIFVGTVTYEATGFVWQSWTRLSDPTNFCNPTHYFECPDFISLTAFGLIWFPNIFSKYIDCGGQNQKKNCYQFYKKGENKEHK